MNLNADHVGFVVASYGLSAVVLIGLVLWVVMRDRAVRKRLAELDQHRP